MLEEKLTELKRDIVIYAQLVEGMLEKSVMGLLKKEKGYLTEVIERKEPRANKFDIELDKLCTVMLAQFEPKARDLRTILMILKMSNDLERMADHIVNIAQSSLFLIDHPVARPMVDIPQMAELTIVVLKNSTNAFIRGDAVVARDVCRKDDVVDQLRDQILKELIAFMGSHPDASERAFHLMRITHNLERIADLSTNICEDVIFMVEGKVIKHHIEA